MARRNLSHGQKLDQARRVNKVLKQHGFKAQPMKRLRQSGVDKPNREVHPSTVLRGTKGGHGASRRVVAQ